MSDPATIIFRAYLKKYHGIEPEEDVTDDQIGKLCLAAIVSLLSSREFKEETSTAIAEASAAGAKE